MQMRAYTIIIIMIPNVCAVFLNKTKHKFVSSKQFDYFHYKCNHYTYTNEKLHRYAKLWYSKYSPKPVNM